MSGYKLLVLDLDGTLLNDRKEITPATRCALLQAQQQGITLVLASGRPTFSIRPLAEQLELSRFGGYVLSYNGARIQHWSTGEVLQQTVLPEDVLPYLYDCSRRSGYAILAYQDGHVVTEQANDEYVKKVSLGNKMPIRKLNDFLKEVRLPLHKCLMVGDPDGLHQWEVNMAAEFGHRMNIYRSSPFIMELVPLGIEKAHSLALLVQHLGITPQQVIAVGDGYNDQSMVRYAGMGVAMANSVPETKEVANYITKHTNNQDGIVEVIHKFIL